MILVERDLKSTWRQSNIECLHSLVGGNGQTKPQPRADKYPPPPRTRENMNTGTTSVSLSGSTWVVTLRDTTVTVCPLPTKDACTQQVCYAHTNLARRLATPDGQLQARWSTGEAVDSTPAFQAVFIDDATTDHNRAPIAETEPPTSCSGRSWSCFA